MLVFAVLSSVFLILVAVHLVNVQFYWRRKNVKNSLKASIIGNLRLLSMQANIASICNELYWSTKEKKVGFFMSGSPSILIKDLNLIKRILVKDFDNFEDRTVSTNYKGDPLGTRTIFVEKNPVWKFMRSKISPCFSSGKLKALFPQMSRIGDNFVEYLTLNEGQIVDLAENCPKYSTDVVTSCAFGIEENCFKNDKSLSREASRRIFIFNISRGFQFCCYFVSPFLTNIFNMKWLDPSASDFVRSMFNNIKIQRLKEGNKDDYVGTLLKMQEKNVFHSDPEEIVAQAAQFFLAGFETVGSTLMFAMYEIAKNDYVQTKLRQSLKDHMELTDGQLTYESLIENEYLTNTMNETLRKYTVLPFIDRKTKSAYYIPEDNLTIDEGTNVYISLQSIHLDPKYYPDPMKFDPERFSSENRHKITPNSFLPFGDGPRNCIGARFGRLSVCTALAKIVSNFKLSLAEDLGELEFDPRGFLLAPTKKIKLIFHKI